MKIKYITTLLMLATIFVNAQPILNWKKNFGGSGIDEVAGTTYDTQGNIYVLGLFSDTVDFNPSTTGVFNLIANTGQKDLFIASYSNSGVFNWAVQIKSTIEIIPKEIHLDNWGGIVYCGSFKGSVDFDPSSSASVNKTSAGGYDAFIARIKSNGTYDNVNGYATTLGGTQDDMATGFSMVNNNQQIFFAGTFRGTVVINGFQGATDTLFAGIGKGIFIQKISGNSGNAQFTGTILGTNAITCDRVFTTSNQQVFIAGKFNTTVDFEIDVEPPFGSGQDTISRFLSSGSFTTNTYIASYTFPNLNLKYAKNLGPNINVTAIEPGKFFGLNGAKFNLHVAGTFSGTVDFDPSTTSTANLTSNGALDAFIAKYDYTGNYIFAKGFGGAADEIPSSIALDSDSNIYVTGSFSGNGVNFDPSLSTNELLNSNGSEDIFFAKYANNGTYLFANNIGGAADDNGVTIKTQENRILLAGNYQSNSVDFDLGTAVDLASNAGSKDFYLAEYKICTGLIDNNMDVQTIYIQSIFSNPNATYKWLNCGNGYSVVPGFNSNVYQPVNVQDLSGGPYAVEITYWGCVDTTFCANAVTVGSSIESKHDNNSLIVSAQDKQLTISILNNNSEYQNISLLNMLGQELKVLNNQLPNGKFTNTYDLSDLKQGIYFVKVSGKNSGSTSKIFIAN